MLTVAFSIFWRTSSSSSSSSVSQITEIEGRGIVWTQIPVLRRFNTISRFSPGDLGPVRTQILKLERSAPLPLLLLLPGKLIRTRIPELVGWVNNPSSSPFPFLFLFPSGLRPRTYTTTNSGIRGMDQYPSSSPSRRVLGPHTDPNSGIRKVSTSSPSSHRETSARHLQYTDANSGTREMGQ